MKKFIKLLKKIFFYINEHKSIDKILNGKEKNFDKKLPDLCEILYTSGSTGNPKGVMLTHKFMIANVMGLEKSLNLDKMVILWPLHHCFIICLTIYTNITLYKNIWYKLVQ